jgi:hypothetical protein
MPSSLGKPQNHNAWMFKLEFGLEIDAGDPMSQGIALVFVTLSILLAVLYGDRAPAGWITNTRAQALAQSIDRTEIQLVEVSGPYLSLPPGPGNTGSGPVHFLFKFKASVNRENVNFDASAHGDFVREYGSEVERMYESFRIRPKD